MASALEIFIRLVTTGQKQAQEALNDTGKSAEKLDKTLSETGKNDGLKGVEEKAKSAGGGLDEATGKALLFQQSLQNINQAGQGLSQLGAGGLAISRELDDVYEKSANVQKRLEGLLSSQGRLSDVGQLNGITADIAIRGHLSNEDEVKEAATQMLSDNVQTKDMAPLLEAAARNAETLKEPLGEVGKLFAKAYAEGDLARLKRANILFSDSEEASVKAAFGISQAAGQAKFMEVAMSATARSTGALGTGLSETQKQANDAARAMHTAQEEMGLGAANASANIQTLTARVVGLVSQNPSVAEGAGEFLTYGSNAASAVGGVVQFSSQALMLVNGIKMLRQAKQGDTIASEAETAASSEAGAAAALAGEEAAGSAAGHDALAVSEGVATVAAETETVAVGGAGAAALVAGGAAETGAVGFGLLGASILAASAEFLPFIALAVAAAAAMKGVDYWTHKDEDEALQKNIDAGNATNQARLDAANKERKKRGQSEITVEQWQAMESDDSGVMTPEDSSKPKAWKSGGDGSGAPTGGDGMPDMSQLQALLTQAHAAPSPSLPSGAAQFAAMPTGTTLTVASAPAQVAAGADDASADVDDDGPLAGETKEHKKLREHAEKVQARAEKQAERAQERDEKKQQREQTREQKLAEHEQKAQQRDALMLQIAQEDADSEDKIAGLKEQLSAAKHDKNAALAGELTQAIADERKNRKYKRDMERASASSDAGHRQTLQTIASMDLARADGSAGAASSASETGGKSKGGGNGQLRAYLEHGGDVNQWKEEEHGSEGGGAASGRGAGGSSGGPTRVSVQMPQAKQTPLDGGKIMLTFVAPPPIVIENPLAHHLEAF